MSFTDLEQHECPVCFIRYAAPAALFNSRRGDGSAFFCPNGHSLSYRETENDKIRRERDRLKQDAARTAETTALLRREWEAAEKRALAAERKTKRVEKRAHAGLCPCCNRSFSELAKHIATKHPGFRAEDVSRENIVAIVKGRSA